MPMTVPSELFLQYGLLGVFIASLLGGTLLPLASELVLLAALSMGLPWLSVLVMAGLGNSIAVGINYLMGYYALAWIQRNFPIPEKIWNRAHRYGWPVLALSWVPIIGDPITLAAGAFRFHWISMIVLAMPLRWIRYVLISLPWIYF